jgi:hypothetical protein
MDKRIIFIQNKGELPQTENQLLFLFLRTVIKLYYVLRQATPINSYPANVDKMVGSCQCYKMADGI